MMIIKDSQTLQFSFIETEIVLKRSHLNYYSMYVNQHFHSLVSINDSHKIISALKQLNKEYGSKIHQNYSFKNLD